MSSSNTNSVYDRLSCVHVATYLRAHGFREIESNDVSSTFVHDSTDIDLLLPKRMDYRDYARAMRSLVRTLTEIESRPEELIVRSILSVASDVVRVRAVGHELRDGTVPFDAFLALGEAARGMMLAAACAANEPRKAYANRKATRVVDYLSSLRFGQTEHGSYVLTVHSAVPPSFPPTQVSLPNCEPADEEPYPRRVTATLLSGLQHVVRGVESYAATGSVDELDASVEHGVSADLCEAVAKLPRSPDSTEITVDWAPSRQAPRATPVRLTPAVMTVAEEAAKYLRAREPEDGFIARGLVKSVERKGEEKSGPAHLLAFVNGEVRTVKLDLAGELWQAAHAALESRDVLQVEGELVKSGLQYRLLNPRNLRVVPAP